MTRPPDEGDVLYLEIDDVLGIYAEVFRCSEQQAADQVRNRLGLAGTIARPRAYAHYEQADLALQAAVLAHGIVEGQHFIEGNKRTALAALRTFLAGNGHDVTASQITRAEWMLELSRGRDAGWLAEQLRGCLSPPLRVITLP